MTDRTTEEAKREAFESWFIRKYLRAPQDSLDLQPDLGICQAWQAALQWQAEQQKRCEYCDGTGDVHSPDGQWRGVCSCPAGKSVAASPHGVPPGYVLGRWSRPRK